METTKEPDYFEEIVYLYIKEFKPYPEIAEKIYDMFCGQPYQDRIYRAIKVSYLNKVMYKVLIEENKNSDDYGVLLFGLEGDVGGYAEYSAEEVDGNNLLDFYYLSSHDLMKISEWEEIENQDIVHLLYNSEAEVLVEDDLNKEVKNEKKSKKSVAEKKSVKETEAKEESFDFIKFHKEVMEEMHEITKRKNADYAGFSGNDPFANFKIVEALGITSVEVGFLTRMTDKLSRINTFVQKGELKVKDESVGDTLKDLANYCILMLGYIKSKK